MRLYKREEYDVLTYLSDLGGLLDVILLLGVFLSSPFVARLFHAALVKKTYRIQQYLNDMTPYYETKKQDDKGHLTSESDSHESMNKFGEEPFNAIEEEIFPDEPPNDKEKLKRLITKTGTDKWPALQSIKSKLAVVSTLSSK